MEKEKLSLQQVLDMGAPEVIRYAVPVMIMLVLAEWGISVYQKRDLYDKKDLFAAATIGIGNLIVSAIIKTALFASVLFFLNLVPWSIPPVWWSYILCLVAIDFCRYWAHRIAHENRFWWATHVTHHNSEKYNWSVSFRLSWVQHIKFIFFVPVALMGFHPVIFFICHQIEVLYQFWIHTEYIRKLPRPIEYIFTTPSHHRVHHATNEKYMDKNYGSTLIIWDRMFGTFQPEEEQAIYGITKPVGTYNPITLVFHEWRDIYKDVSKARNLSEARKYIFGRPSELAKESEKAAN
jgi:sterol desaturase/sphingolipid hydroxylase (fatty acid hydroxylase superfamily)